ncbi:MAG: phosphoribosylformylglycinamidine synthase I [Candidatus Velthaea sp.]
MPRVAVPVYPGTNSEDETLRALLAVGLDAEIVHWSRGAKALRAFDAFVVPGGFAYEDRVRAGAVAAHDELTDAVIEAAQAGKYVLGICNGAQVLAEAGLVPGTGPLRLPTAAFTPNLDDGRYICTHVYVKLNVPPARVPALGSLAPNAVIPMWVSHGEGRLQARSDELARIRQNDHVAFIYCDARGNPVAAPQGSALACAGLTNLEGNVVAIMPHPERDAWSFMHPEREGTRHDARTILAPSGGIVFFEAFARAVKARAGAAV